MKEATKIKVAKKELYAHPGWQWCTFEGAELHTLLLGLKSTFREKLEWLEEAEDVTLALGASPLTRQKKKTKRRGKATLRGKAANKRRSSSNTHTKRAPPRTQKLD